MSQITVSSADRQTVIAGHSQVTAGHCALVFGRGRVIRRSAVAGGVGSGGGRCRFWRVR